MLNRRLIRVKVYQAFYAYVQSEQSGINASLAYLDNSLKGIYNTFFTFITFPLELSHYIEQELDPTENLIPSPEKVQRFNIMIFKDLRDKLLDQAEIKRMMKKTVVSWSKERNTLHMGYKKIQKASFLEKYMDIKEYTLEDQISFLKDCYKFMAGNFEEFDSFMEEIEMHWEDEKQPVFKSAEQFADNLITQLDSGNIEIPSLAKNIDEDMEFANELLKKSIRYKEEYTKLISGHTKGWDADRIARSDMLLMVMALVEYTEFPYIPVKVTLNEYLEIAKKYSTPQSSKFLNGVLDKLLAQFKEDGKINKKGRGLME